MADIKQQPSSVIYFAEDSGAMAKSLALRVRDQGAATTLIYARLFKTEADIVEHAAAVVIQADCMNAGKIALCYERFAHNCEIHYVDAQGDFIDEPDHIREEREADSAVLGKTADPKQALKNLAAASGKDKPSHSADAQPPADEPGTDAEGSGEDGNPEPSPEDVHSDGADGGGEPSEPDGGVSGEGEDPEDTSG